MSKFKVGDKVRVRKDLMIGKIYGGWGFTEKMEKYKNEIFTIKAVYKCENELKEIGHCWTDEMLEEVKEDKMEKTFREVIADIKEGEVWKALSLEIEKDSIGITIRGIKGNTTIGDNFTFNLKRKEYTFEEAFKAYEEGKEIESILTGDKFKKKKRSDESDFDSYWDEGLEVWWKNEEFSLEIIRNKWYIND
ncbi:hypothetical protein ACQPUZ_10610 [Clostridium tertium]